VVLRLVGRTAKFFKMKLEADNGVEMNIKLSGNSSGGHACSQHASCDIVLCDKTAHPSGFLLTSAQDAPV
jgi:hypothetical protein